MSLTKRTVMTDLCVKVLKYTKITTFVFSCRVFVMSCNVVSEKN